MSVSPASSGATESDKLPVPPASYGKVSIPSVNQEADTNESDETPQGCQVKITLNAEEAAKLEELCAQNGITAKATMFRALLTQAVNAANKSDQSTGAIILDLQTVQGATEIPSGQPSIEIPIPTGVGNSIYAKAEERAVAMVAQQMIQAASTNITEQEIDSNP